MSFTNELAKIKAESGEYGETVVHYRGLRIEHFHDPDGNGPGKPVYQCLVSRLSDDELSGSLECIKDSGYFERYGFNEEEPLNLIERGALEVVYKGLVNADLF